MSIPEFKERVVQFGRASHLNGILTVPKGLTADPAIILLMTNSGILSRVGASRLQVELARHASRQGIAAFRFDLSGLGDSDVPDSTDGIQQIVDQDIHDAIELLKKQYPDAALVGFGLCSGAYDFFHDLENRRALSGAVLLDLSSHFKNKSHLIRHYINRLRLSESWRNFAANPAHKFTVLKYRISTMQQNSKNQELSADAEIGIRPTIGRQRFETTLDYAIANEIRLLFVYTGGTSEYYNYENQFADTFPEQSKSKIIKWIYMPAADHMFSKKTSRDRLFALLENWLTKEFLST